MDAREHEARWSQQQRQRCAIDQLAPGAEKSAPKPFSRQRGFQPDEGATFAVSSASHKRGFVQTEAAGDSE